MLQINSFLQKINTSHHFSEILSGASRSLFIKIAGLFIAYLFSFVVARYFGAQAWGVFSLALSVIMFGAILGSAGLDIAALKITAGLDGKKKISSSYKSAFIIVSVLSICSSVIVFLLSGWIAGSVFGNPNLTSTFQLSAFGVFPYCVFNLNARVLQGLNKINKYVFIRFVSHHFAALLLLVILILFWEQSQVILFAYIGGIYLIVGISFYWLAKEGIRPFRFTDSKKKPKNVYRLLKMSMPLLFANSLIFINGWVDTVMVGFFMTEEDVGVYNIALKISGSLLFVLTSVNAVVAPNFSKLFSQGKMSELKEMIRYSTSLIFFTTLPLFLVLVLFPEQVLSIFGDEFVRGRDVLIVLCIGSLLSAFAGPVGYFLQMTESQVAFQNITLVSFLSGFILNLFLIPNYGILGAAIATCVSMIFWNGACVLFIKNKYNIIAYYRPFGKWKKN